MFYCEACAKKNDWPPGFPHPESRGPCEVCGKTAVCTDIPSRALPEPKRKPNIRAALSEKPGGDAAVLRGKTDLMEALRECSDILANTNEAHYAGIKDYPGMRLEYERAMEPVDRARALLSSPPPADWSEFIRIADDHMRDIARAEWTLPVLLSQARERIGLMVETYWPSLRETLAVFPPPPARESVSEEALQKILSGVVADAYTKDDLIRAEDIVRKLRYCVRRVEEVGPLIAQALAAERERNRQEPAALDGLIEREVHNAAIQAAAEMAGRYVDNPLIVAAIRSLLRPAEGK